jgi:hypothetical protein
LAPAEGELLGPAAAAAAEAEAAGEEEGTTEEGTELPNPRTGVFAGVRADAAEAAGEADGAGRARCGVIGPAAAAAAVVAAGDPAGGIITVLVFSGVPSEVPPTGALFGCGRRDTKGAGRLMLTESRAVAAQLQRQREQSVRRMQGRGTRHRRTWKLLWLESERNLREENIRAAQKMSQRGGFSAGCHIDRSSPKRALELSCFCSVMHKHRRNTPPHRLREPYA